MPTTTTNFGWTVPSDTDLVKDGAAAIRTLGSSIDTSFVDLKGGTTGQVLAKASGTDLDFSWVAQDDSNAIQNAIVDAKGDLIAATAADTPARLAVGTNGQVLTADSTAATGLAWTTVGGSSGPAFFAKRTGSNQSISLGTATKVQFNTEEFDTDNCYDSTTNYRFTPTKAGYYQFNASALITGGGMTASEVGFRKNNVNWAFGSFAAPAVGYNAAFCGSIIYLNGSTDYVEVFATIYGGSGNIEVSLTTVFNGIWIRS